MPNPANGMVTVSRNSDGDTATYTCDQGYELMGAETLTCLSIGAQWNDSLPECEIIGTKVIVLKTCKTGPLTDIYILCVNFRNLKTMNIDRSMHKYQSI